jgi:hypothetical protein
MKRFFVTLSVLVSLFFISCQKEAGFSDGGNSSGGGSTGSGLLSRLVSKSGSDSSVLAFGYNSSKRLITLNISTYSGGSGTSIQERAERNAQGAILRVIIKGDSYQQAGIDSIITVLNSSAGRYNSKVTSFDLTVIVLKDSVALTYDGNGKVISERSFADNGNNAYEEYQKVEYTYSGSNLAAIKTYSYDSGSSSYTLEETYTYDQYDAKISPLYFGTEAFVFDSPFFVSLNNPIKSTLISTGSPTQNYTTTYTYNSSNKPVTATSTIQPGNATTIGTYYYQ